MKLLARLAYMAQMFGFVGMRVIKTPSVTYRKKMILNRDKAQGVQNYKVNTKPYRRGNRGK